MNLVKHLLLLPVVCLLSCEDKDNELAPNADPEAIKTTFNAHFSSALDVEWESINNTYEAEFEVSGVAAKIY